MTGTAISVRAAAPATPTTKHLASATVPVAALDSATVDEAFELFRRAYEGADRARFARDLAEKQRVILLRDRETHALRGFSTVLIRPIDGPQGPGTVVFSGDTVIDREYWGQKRLQVAFVRLLLSLKARAPRRPLYWFLISKGYRTYLLLANAFPRAVPRHDRPDDAWLRQTLDRLAIERFGPQYDPSSGVVRYDTAHERVREGLAPVTPTLLENPHVRFFVARNPGHLSGDELACLAEVRLVDLIRVGTRLGQTLTRRLLGGSSTGAAR